MTKLRLPARSSVAGSTGLARSEVALLLTVLALMIFLGQLQYQQISRQARLASVTSVAEGLRDAAHQVFVEALIRRHGASESSRLELHSGHSIELTFGYPVATEQGIASAIDLSRDFQISYARHPDGRPIAIYRPLWHLDAPGCYVTYGQPIPEDPRPMVHFNIQGC